MIESDVGQPRGVLKLNAGEKKFSLFRRRPAPDLEGIVEHHWIVKWDLRGQAPYLQETLPHPSVHLVFEKGKSRVVGVTTGRFSYLLQDKGLVYGVKFKPGAFFPFIDGHVSALTDCSPRVHEVFGDDAAALEVAVLGQLDDRDMIAMAEAFIRDRCPCLDENVVLVNRIVDRIITDRTITKVDDLVAAAGMGKRVLQRMFDRYVGVSPKWVIKRYRLHEAVEKLNGLGPDDWAALALELGYFDQAHFVRDFKKYVGISPARYFRDQDK